MKIALISDIHGNYHALEAVLIDISDHNVDEIICLGDLATIGPQPLRVIRRLREMGIVTIMGNHDLALLDPDKAGEFQIAPPLLSSLKWCCDQMEEPDFTFIRKFHPTLEVKPGSNQSILMFHGSPKNAIDIIRSETPTNILDQYFAEFQQDIFIGGHTHYQLLRQYGQKLIINPGSVGACFRGDTILNSEPSINPWAEYAIIDITDNGLGIKFQRINYDIGSYIALLEESDLPVKDWWISQLSSPGN